jgi:CIC family chloride channel protein
MRGRLPRQLLPITQNTRILLEAVLLGMTIGVLATLYRKGIQHFTWGFREVFRLLPAWTGFLMPVFGAFCLIGILRLFRTQVREYVPEVIEASIRHTTLRLKDGIVCLLTSLITLTSGGSAGPEGPMAFAGAATGSLFGKWMGLDRRRAKIFLAAGTAAGIAAIFNAPIAGVLFALELILLNDLTMSAVTPVILASVSASTVNYYYMGNQPTFVVPPFIMRDYLELFAYAFLGVLGGFASMAFVRIMFAVGRLFQKFPRPAFRPVAGSLLVGILLLFLPQVGGYGHDYITRVLHGHEPLTVVLALVVFKMLATSFTLGSGNSGGIFAPSLLVGAALGAGTGMILHLVVSGAGPVASYATVGMAAVMAGTIQAPLTAMMLIFEVTRDYHVMLPLMTATVISTAVAYGLKTDSIYLMTLTERNLDFRRIRDLGALADVHAKDVMRRRFTTIEPGDTPAEIRAKFRNTSESQALYVTPAGELLGMIPVDTFHLLDGSTLEDLAIPDPPTVRPSDTIYETLTRLRHSRGLVAVVDDDRHVLGVVSKTIFIEKLLPLLQVYSARRSGL